MKKITFSLFLSAISFAMESEKTALVTGITGQDAPYMAKLLLEKNYKHVYGSYRRSSKSNFSNIEELGIKNHPHFHLVEMDVTDSASVLSCIKETAPDEVYNFAAQSFVGVSFKEPLATLDITGKGPVHILDAIRLINPKIKFYQASTSELFGKVQEIPQKETTPFYPRSPYGVAKLFAHWSTINYRESYDLFACCGILFNHESPLRGDEFVTRKITQAVARIKTGKQEYLELGSLDSKRDWGFAGDYVEGAYLMLQQEKAEEYVLATNHTETVRFFVEKAFAYADITIEWYGEGVNEYGVDKDRGKTVVKVDPKFYRPAEVDILIGDYSKAKNKLGWQPKVQLEDLIKMMVDADLEKESK